MTGATPEAELQVFPQAQSPCLVRLNARPWARTVAVRAGGLAVGIRARDDYTADRLDSLFSSIRVPDLDDVANPNFSVDLAHAASEFKRLALVYRDHEVVARRREEVDLLSDLVDLVSDVPKLLNTNLLSIAGTALLSDENRLTLLPGRLYKKLLVARERLSADGFTLVNSQFHLYDAEQNRVLLQSEDRELAELQNQTRFAGERSTAAKLSKWGIPAMGNDVYRLRRAEAVYGAATSVLNRDLVGTRTTLRALATLAEQCEGWTFPVQVSASRAQANLLAMHA